jgi:hypothetical protein
MNQQSSKPRTTIHWWILRGLLEVLRVLLIITGYVAPFVVFVVVLIACIIGVVKGSVSLLAVVPAFLLALVEYFALCGLILVALWALMALLKWVLPPEYRSTTTKRTHTNLLPHAEE